MIPYPICKTCGKCASRVTFTEDNCCVVECTPCGVSNKSLPITREHEGKDLARFLQELMDNGG